MIFDRHLSGHRPILLREADIDYGLTPFQLFHYWFSFLWVQECGGRFMENDGVVERDDIVSFKAEAPLFEVKS